MQNNLLLSTPAIIAIVVVVAVVVILIGVIIGLYNSLVRLKNACEEGWATIDVQLKKRYDLIPNLVETVKGYAAHESETLEGVIKARNLAMTATADEEKMKAENALTGTLRSIFALSESYPELKANQNFMDLQRQLQSIETEIASARRYYNGTVKALNTKIEVFPSNLFAKMFHIKKRAYFEAEESDRQNVQVKF